VSKAKAPAARPAEGAAGKPGGAPGARDAEPGSAGRRTPFSDGSALIFAAIALAGFAPERAGPGGFFAPEPAGGFAAAEDPFFGFASDPVSYAPNPSSQSSSSSSSSSYSS
jgi:hypothetical protein